MSQASTSAGITSDDKLWAALGYLPIVGWIIAIIALIMEDKRARPFIKLHSIQALILALVNGLIAGALAVVIVGCITGVAGAIYMLYLGYQAYQGVTVNVPWLTGFIHSQGWA